MNVIKKFKMNMYYILSFFIPGSILLVVFGIFGVFPFGSKSILILDLSGQYVEFFACLREIVLGDRSLLFSWGKTLGGNFIGFYSYYLSSPFSFLTLLFPLKNISEALFFITLLKISFAGLTFSIALNYLFKKKDLSLIIFSSLYALMSYTILYAQNIMWLDSLIWLPIIIIGVEKILKNGRILLLTVSLSVMFISCYYISFPLGIFVFIYLIYRLAQSANLLNGKEITRILLKFTASVGLAVGVSSWLIVPTVYALMQGKISNTYLLPEFEVKFNMYQMLSKLFVGSYENINNLGTPNIYCGLLISILVILFFINKNIDKRDKYLSASIIIFFLMSMTLNLVDIAWHGFQAPNWFPSRYSFLFCFFLLITAYKSWINIHTVSLFQFKIVAMIVFGFAFTTHMIHYKYLPEEAIYLTYTLVATYLICLIMLNRKEKLAGIIIFLILILTVGELYYNTSIMIKGLDKQVGYRERSDYSDFRKKMDPVIQEVQETDNSFYRMEMKFYRGRNEAVGFGYRGISHYSSIYDQAVNNFCGKMGMAQENTRLIYNGATMWTDSLFSVKYIMSKNKINNYYVPISVHGDVTVYENPYALNLGFMIRQNSQERLYDNVNPFVNQNNLIMNMTGIYETSFKDVTNVRIDSQNLVYSQNGEKLTFTKNRTQEDGIVYYTFKAPYDGPLYSYFTSDIDEDCELFVNDKFVSIIFDAEKQCIMYLGEFKKGEEIKAKFVMKRNVKEVNKTYFATLDMSIFKKMVNSLKQEEFKITKMSDTNIEGTIDVKDKRIFFTSIPYDKGWRISVDGKRINQQKYDGTLTCFPLSAGQHMIKMNYIPIGLMPGIIISLVSVIIVLIITVLNGKKYKLGSLNPMKMFKK